VKKAFYIAVGFALSLICSAARAQNVAVFSEPGFPTADTAAPQRIEALLPAAKSVSAEGLGKVLAAPATSLLVLPYGSSFPEAEWPDIQQFLQRGGNLLVLGGRPFSRSAFHDTNGWHLRDYNVRFMRSLMIDQYQETPGSDGEEFQANPDMPMQLARFAWKRAFSPVIRLSAVDLYKRGGAAGSIDARLDALAWGIKDGRKMSAPAIVVDHLRNGFDGGRWVFLNAELSTDFYTSVGAEIVRSLAEFALQGSQEFTARPVFPLYLPGEPIQLNLEWHSKRPGSGLTVKIVAYPEAQPSKKTETTTNLISREQITLAAPTGQGLYLIDATLMQGSTVRAIYHTGFWIRDEQYLNSGPRLAVNKDYFELDGKPMAVVGTTYMSSEVQRLYFEYPNVYVWNRELGEINRAGLNMVRTGWWTGWDKFCNENGEPYERTYRTLEAYLMTARKYGLPIQFNFFAFLPDVLGGVNPYLDPAAVRRQKTLISSIVARFHDVPWLAWDFINEPSISQHLWTMRPNGDPIELQAWNTWLNQRYPDKAALAAAWNVPAASVQGTVPLPEDIEFTQRGGYVGKNSLKVYDFFMFSQDVFVKWVNTMRDAVRAAGSQQLVTVGQDEGGIQDRLSPAFWGPSVSFTTNHSWWQNDYIVWDSLLAKQPGETMLIQETGLQREINLDEIVRRDPEAEASLLERKVAASFIQGAGAIEWLWNTNSYMTESNETPIGLVRPDGTEKPEATTMRAYASFAKAMAEHLHNPQQPSIAIVTSQAAQFSVLGDMQLKAQQEAVRALTYQGHFSAYAVAENRLEQLGSPKLAILPSPQALSDAAWRALLQYVENGGNLLITGPVDRDEHWHEVPRASELKLAAAVEPLMFHSAALRLGSQTVPLNFDQQTQNFVETLRFPDGASLKEIPYGRGRIYWVAYPVELAEGTQAAAELYMTVATKVGIVPAYDLATPLASGVLVYATVLDDSVMYLMISDTADDSQIDLRDKLTGTRITLPLSAQHAAIAIVSKKERSVVAKLVFK
jgi:hypothetical protein